MTATTAVTLSYLLGLLAFAFDIWRARALREEARQRITEASEAA